MTLVRFLAGAGVLLVVLGPGFAGAAAPAPLPQKVSYARDVLPLFQQHCMGCHQPAKAGGGFVMTSHAALFKKGDSDLPGVVPGKPDESRLLAQITPKDGKTEMPRGKPPLAPK